MSDPTLLIGGTGFLGSFVAWRLAGPRLAVLVRPTSDVSVLPKGIELRRAALEDEPLPLHGVSTVVYCASMGFGHVPGLVRRLEEAGVSRALFVSTTAIFTSLPSASKAIRLEAEDAVQRSKLDWTILRPTMVYGTERDRNVSRLLRFLKRWPLFPTCGNALWQPIYVHDLADAVVAALASPRTSGHVYNLAGASPLRFDDLLRTAAQAIGRGVLLVRVPVAAVAFAARATRVVSPEQVRRLAEDKAFDYSDASLDFGFRPRSFAEGVKLEARSLGMVR